MKTYQELITEMGRGDVNELKSRLPVAIEHLLKLKHMTGRRLTDNRRGWEQSLRNQYNELAVHLKRNNAIKTELTPEVLDKAHRAAIAKLTKEYPTVNFPKGRTLSLEEIVGPGAWEYIKPKPKLKAPPKAKR